MLFKVGDQVQWTSQAGGYVRTKVGTVAQVIPPQCYPERSRFLHLYKNSGVGSSRDHESYVVTVRHRPYWPRANQLQPAGTRAPIGLQILDYLHSPLVKETLIAGGEGGVISEIQRMCEKSVAGGLEAESYRRVAFEVLEPLLRKLLDLEAAFGVLKSPPWPSLEEIKDAHRKLKDVMAK